MLFRCNLIHPFIPKNLDSYSKDIQQFKNNSRICINSQKYLTLITGWSQICHNMAESDEKLKIQILNPKILLGKYHDFQESFNCIW